MHGCPILLSLLWWQTNLDSTDSPITIKLIIEVSIFSIAIN